MWYSAVHIPTLCYKHGAAVGTSEGLASKRFTSRPAVVASGLSIFVLAFVIAFAICFGIGLATEATDQGTFSDTESPRRSAPERSSPLEPESSPLDTSTELVECIAIARARGYDVSVLLASILTLRDAGQERLDLCNDFIGR